MRETIRAGFRGSSELGGLRFFVVAFVALVLLAGVYATRHAETWRIAFKVAAGTTGAVAVGCGVWSYVYTWRGRLARRGFRLM